MKLFASILKSSRSPGQERRASQRFPISPGFPLKAVLSCVSRDETGAPIARITALEVAERRGKPQSFVAKYEGGERRLDVIEFVAVARALELDPKALIDRLMRE